MMYGVTYESYCLSHTLSRVVPIDDEVTGEVVNALADFA